MRRIDVRIIQTLLGHAKLETTACYRFNLDYPFFIPLRHSGSNIGGWTMADQFETIALQRVEEMLPRERDVLPFGVVGLDDATVVHIYNATEARMSGLDPASVMGVPFFEAVGQCMNNFMVAQRFEDEVELDEIVPYVLTLRMRPTRVRLRLLASPSARYRYVLIER